jgi:enoyl-[acyl-carrier protein] reductase I
VRQFLAHIHAHIQQGVAMGFLSGKKILVTGVLSNRSIAYGIAKACHAQGAELAFSYVGERFKERITEFAADFNSTLIFDCDVGDDAQQAGLAAIIPVRGGQWPDRDRLTRQEQTRVGVY